MLSLLAKTHGGLHHVQSVAANKLKKRREHVSKNKNSQRGKPQQASGGTVSYGVRIESVPMQLTQEGLRVPAVLHQLKLWLVASGGVATPGIFKTAAVPPPPPPILSLSQRKLREARLCAAGCGGTTRTASVT